MDASHSVEGLNHAGTRDALSSDLRSEQLEQLLDRCARRDEQALPDLYRLVSAQLFGMLLRILKRRALAEEALQDVMVRVWQNAGQYESYRGRAMPWLISIARYRAIDLLRTQRAHKSLDEAPKESLVDRSSEEFSDTTISQRVHAALARCLGRLPKDQRRCIVLAYVNGYSHGEIADFVGSPVATVRSWMHRGLSGLRRCLDS